MNKPQMNLQDTFLNHARKENVGVTIYLVNSVQLRGNVRGFDSFTILLDTPGKPPQLVYKHAVTSIVPMRQIAGLQSELIKESPATLAAGSIPTQGAGSKIQTDATTVDESPKT